MSFPCRSSFPLQHVSRFLRVVRPQCVIRLRHAICFQHVSRFHHASRLQCVSDSSRPACQGKALGKVPSDRL